MPNPEKIVSAFRAELKDFYAQNTDITREALTWLLQRWLALVDDIVGAYDADGNEMPDSVAEALFNQIADITDRLAAGAPELPK